MTFLVTVAFVLNYIAAANENYRVEYSNLNSKDIYQQRIYVKVSANEEMVVVSTAKGSIANIQSNHYITHVDDVEVFSGNMDAFFAGGNRKAMIPVLDDSDFMEDGKRLLGFIKVKSLSQQEHNRRFSISLRLGDGKRNSLDTVRNEAVHYPGFSSPEHWSGGCVR